jgi:hypothetical protein
VPFCAEKREELQQESQELVQEGTDHVTEAMRQPFDVPKLILGGNRVDAVWSPAAPARFPHPAHTARGCPKGAAMLARRLVGQFRKFPLVVKMRL